MRRLPLYPASIGDLWLSDKEGVMQVITKQAHTRACYVFGLRIFQMANPAVRCMRSARVFIPQQGERQGEWQSIDLSGMAT